MTARTLRPHLIIVSSTYPRWVDEYEPRFVHDLARHLLDTYRVTVLAPRSPGAVDREVLDGVEVIRYAYAPRAWETLVNDGGILGNLRRAPWKIVLVPSFVLSAVMRLRRLIAAGDVDLVHAHWIVPGGIVAAFGCRDVPFVLTAHGSDVFGLRGRVMARIKSAVLRRAAWVTSVSKPMADRLLGEGVARDRLSVMPMGTDMSRFRQDPSVARDVMHILFVGRFVAIKGIDVLLDAVALLANDYPALRVSLVGTGPERQRLEDRCNRLGIAVHVVFLGSRTHDDLVPLYRSASLLIWPSIILPGGQQEGLGMVVAEAAACGCPLLLSDQPAMRWLVDDAHEMFFRAGDAVDLARAIRVRLDAPQRFREVDERARAVIVGKLDWTEVAKGYASVFARVLGDSPESERGST